MIDQDKDPELLKIAKKRVAFKQQAAAYVIVNTMLWIVWFLSGQNDHDDLFPWPLWPMFGWGIGLAFQYYNAYVSRTDAVDREYEKLKNKGL